MLFLCPPASSLAVSGLASPLVLLGLDWIQEDRPGNQYDVQRPRHVEHSHGHLRIQRKLALQFKASFFAGLRFTFPFQCILFR
jgi:hypothetical protein